MNSAVCLCKHLFLKTAIAASRRSNKSSFNIRTISSLDSKRTETASDVADTICGKVCNVQDDYVELKASSQWHNPRRFHVSWLRDSCQCQHCHDRYSSLHFSLVNKTGSTNSIRNITFEKDQMFTLWSDGHQTIHDINWLWNNTNNDDTPIALPVKTLWDSSNVGRIRFTEVLYKDLLESEDSVGLILDSLLQYGIAIINGVPVTSEDTRLAMERIGPVWRTFWGEIFYVVDDLTKHSHPSYTGADLHLHTDTNYYFEGAGLQAFHVLEHTGTGGTNKFVDGFFVAKSIKSNHPDVYDYLSTQPVSFKYIAESKLHLVNEDVVLRHDPVTGELMQIRFTPYDLDIFRTIPHDKIESHYRALTVLRSELDKPGNGFHLKLNPGRLLITDNWRIFHGRSSFTGRRTLCGMYVSRSDFLSRARKLNLVK